MDNKILKRSIWIILLFTLLVVIYDRALYSKIPQKVEEEYVRIGYINLHETKITLKELEKLKSYNCDLWFFLEWNGNNLDNLPSFMTDYFKTYEHADSQTFGTLILSKDSTASAEIILSNQPPYACNYTKHQIQFQGLTVILVHAPPPVPTCKFETSDYLRDLTKSLSKDARNPQIILGDFNTFPFQKSIRNLKNIGYKDAYNQLHTLPAGTFAPTTWLPKILRFDYVLYRGNLLPKLVERFNISTSDHAGWIADFKVKG